MYILERLPRETNQGYALRTIQHNIINFGLEPGARISENELAAALGLSRTPVREALMMLEKVKIVEIVPQKRGVVSYIDLNLLEESRFMRQVLESAVLDLDCEMATPEDILRLEEAVKLQQFSLTQNYADSLMELDSKFHRMLFEIANKPQSYALMDSIDIHYVRVRRLVLERVKDEKIVEDHAHIVAAIKAGDAKEAQHVLKKHLNRYKFDMEAIRAQYPQYFKA